MKYLKVFVDFIEDMETLNDAECGRLFRAMLKYASNEELTELKGNERFLWAGAKKTIDRQREGYSNKVAGAEKARTAKNNNSDINLIASDIKSNQEQSSRLPLISTQDKDEDIRQRHKTKDKDKEDVAFSPSYQLAEGSVFILDSNLIQQLTEDFPMLDTWRTLADIKRWCAANPNKRKTRAGAERFVNAWFVGEEKERQV